MSKQAKEEAWQHFVHLLESPDLKAFSELKKAVEETHGKCVRARSPSLSVCRAAVRTTGSRHCCD